MDRLAALTKRRPDPARTAERLIYLVPPVIGVGVVGVLQDAETGLLPLQWVLIIIGTIGYAAIVFGLSFTLFVDARDLRPGAGWSPNPWVTAAGVLVAGPFALSPFVAIGYLHRRYEHVGVTPGWSGWWTVVALSLGATLFGSVAAIVGLILSIPALALTGVALAGAIAFGSFPIAIHQDAAFVAAQGRSWQPNPATYLGLALVSLFVPPLQPLLAIYYLLRRRRLR